MLKKALALSLSAVLILGVCGCSKAATQNQNQDEQKSDSADKSNVMDDVEESINNLIIGTTGKINDQINAN